MTRGDIAHSGRQEETVTKIGQRHNRERLTEGKKKKKNHKICMSNKILIMEQ